MNNGTKLILVIAIFAVLAWILLKDKDEVFLTFAMTGVGTVVAGGRNRTVSNAYPKTISVN